MPGQTPDPAASPLTWGEDGLPRSRLYGDVYFSAEGGLDESRAVFLTGCGLPDTWKGRAHFTVAELGFGTGLNIAALLDLWRRTAEPGALLHIFSVEAHPISRAEAQRALAHWPQVSDVTDALTQAWPGQAHGVHRVDLPAFGAVLDLAVMDAGEALAAWDGKADAWFLDGFSPAANPQMWREDLLALVAARSHPGARAATFTVAGAVRRGLEAAGFAVEKRPGFGRKRQRLEASLPGLAPTLAPNPRVAIFGAGIAGAALARAFRAQGIEAQVFGAPDGASRNPAALVTPRLDAGLGPPARLYADSFRRATALYGQVTGAVIAQGARQLESGERDARRFAAIAASDLFEPGSMRVQGAAMVMGEALVVEPAIILDAWLGPLLPPVETLERHGDVWRLHAAGQVHEADVVCLAAGHACADLAAGLPLQPVRGQASWASIQIAQAASFGGYAIPMRGGVLFGATHDRDVTGTDVREEDNARNLALVAKGLPDLAAQLASVPLEARASIRATTPDRLPLAGCWAEGLFVLSGLGSKGFCAAPLLAEHIAASALARPSPLARALSALVDPERFSARDNPRRGGPPRP
jgi:tRNA 5-methylaminomethyl-2-thiouridine biosynthesis bifunctional protein